MRWWREPAVHFALVGAAIFAADRWMTPEPQTAAPALVADDALEARVGAALQLELGRPPIESELRAGVDAALDQEALVREALALGLDRGDPIIERRLAQKMRFLIEDGAQIDPPTEPEVDAYIAANPEMFARSPHIALEHVWLREGDTVSPAEHLAALRTGAAPNTIGAPFLRGPSFSARPAESYTEVFGPEFTLAIAGLEVGAWSGPVPSAFGHHLVRPTAREDAAIATTAQRAIARHQLLQTRRAAAERVALDALRHRHGGPQ